MILNTSADKVAHLLRRTGFAASKQQIDALASLTLDAVITRIVNAPSVAATPPAGFESPMADPANMPDAQQTALPLWWVKLMAQTSNPLQEKMTLFWHGHFTSALHKVYFPGLMLRQNQLLRRHALGNFRQFAYEISIDAAMMIWLDNNNNHKNAPNENYARELMELCTLGIGNYSEQDVREAARALTGWKLNHSTGQVSFDPASFDAGTKTVLGRTGPLGLKDTTDHLVTRTACGMFIATKLFSYFAYPNPQPSVIYPLAGAFVNSGYDIRALLTALFKSDAFYSDRAYRALIKSPAEYVAGMLALFPKFSLKYETGLPKEMGQMGQMLFDPPHVAGWPDGPAWLGSSMMFARFNIADTLCRELPASMLPGYTAATNAEMLTHCLEQLGVTDISAQTRQQVESYMNSAGASREIIARGILNLLLVSPEFQTK